MGPKRLPGSESPTLRDYIAISLELERVMAYLGTASRPPLKEEWRARYAITDMIIKECRGVPPAAAPGIDNSPGG